MPSGITVANINSGMFCSLSALTAMSPEPKPIMAGIRTFSNRLRGLGSFSLFIYYLLIDLEMIIITAYMTFSIVIHIVHFGIFSRSIYLMGYVYLLVINYYGLTPDKKRAIIRLIPTIFVGVYRLMVDSAL